VGGARGGVRAPDASGEFGEAVSEVPVRHFLRGIDNVRFVRAEGWRFPPQQRAASLRRRAAAIADRSALAA